MDIENPEENVQDEMNDSSPNILNQGEDVPDEEEDEYEDHSMFNMPIDPLKKEEDYDVNPGDTTTNNQTLGIAKAFKCPSTGTTVAFSLEELETLKKNKPTKYLKVIMSARGSSSDKCSSSSTVSGSQSTNKPTDELLKKIKEKAFDVNLLQVLQNNPTACFGIKDLLKQVDILTTPPEIVDIVMELGLLIDKVSANLNRKSEVLNKIKNKTNSQTAEWVSVTKPTNKVSELEKGVWTKLRRIWNLH